MRQAVDLNYRMAYQSIGNLRTLNTLAEKGYTGPLKGLSTVGTFRQSDEPEIRKLVQETAAEFMAAFHEAKPKWLAGGQPRRRPRNGQSSKQKIEVIFSE